MNKKYASLVLISGILTPEISHVVFHKETPSLPVHIQLETPLNATFSPQLHAISATSSVVGHFYKISENAQI